MLVIASVIQESKNESLLVEQIFSKPEWKRFKHYVTGFVSIPSHFMTEKLAHDIRLFNEKIITHPLSFISNEDERNSTRRLAEELGINLALQSNITPELITTLKTEDGPGSKKSLESLYYGCLNQVNE